jgi:hypothetical protein
VTLSAGFIWLRISLSILNTPMNSSTTVFLIYLDSVSEGMCHVELNIYCPNISGLIEFEMYLNCIVMLCYNHFWVITCHISVSLHFLMALWLKQSFLWDVTPLHCVKISRRYDRTWGHTVAQSLVELRYKQEGRGFDSYWYHWYFS